MLRNRAQMLARIRRLLRDEDAQQWDDDEILADMAVAHEWVAADVVKSQESREWLRKYSEPANLEADTEEYALPTDCLLVRGVETRADAEVVRWTVLPRRRPPRSVITSGTMERFATSGGAYALRGWYDDTGPGSVRIWPALTVEGEEVIEAEYRFDYLHLPAFLADDDNATFNDPEATGTDVEQLPNGWDACVEYLTAALLAHEETENGRPIQAFGQMYAGQFQRLGPGRLYQTPRYVRDVAGPGGVTAAGGAERGRTE